jgi:hypothetical protein
MQLLTESSEQGVTLPQITTSRRISVQWVGNSSNQGKDALSAHQGEQINIAKNHKSSRSTDLSIIKINSTQNTKNSFDAEANAHIAITSRPNENVAPGNLKMEIENIHQFMKINKHPRE